METKIDSVRIQNISRSFGFGNCFALNHGIECEGLAILWQSDVCLDVFYSSDCFFGVNVTEGDGLIWSLWLCHCPAKRSIKRVFWNNLGETITQGRDNCACAGDFNDVASQKEKMGGKRFTSKSNFFLYNFMTDMGAIDLGFNGNSFIWCNKMNGEANIREHMDRFFVSTDWRIRFDRVGVIHLHSSNSYHSPILLCSVIDHPSRPKSFRFLDGWTRDPNCECVIQEAWTRIDMRRSRAPFVSRIRNTARALQYWICQTQVKELETQLKYVQGLDPTQANLDRERELQNLLNEWLFQLEDLWRQNSKELWLKV